jgi:hypothetical protein
MPKIEDGVKKFNRKAKAAAVGPNRHGDKHGADKIKAVLAWFLAGLYRWSKHICAVLIYWSLERVDDLRDLLASVFWLLLLRSRGERKWRRQYRRWEREDTRADRREYYGVE